MNFSIIIPNLNGALFLKNLLTSLAVAINNCPDSKFQIILVDNNSKDNSTLIFQEIFDEIRKKYLLEKTEYWIYRNQKNLGFAGAVNIGINKAKYEWVVVLNNDLKLDQNWFKNITKTKINSKIAAICGSVLNAAGTHFESQGLSFFYSGKAQNINNKIKFSSKLIDVPQKTVWGASGAATVYNKKIIKKIGNFDETFFAYEEDVDLSLRLNIAGYQTLLIPNCLSYHQGGATSNKMGNFRSYHDTRNWYFIIIKNYSLKQFLSNFPSIFYERLKNLKYLVQSTHPFYKVPIVVLTLYGDILKNTRELLKKRKVIQKLVK